MERPSGALAKGPLGNAWPEALGRGLRIDPADAGPHPRDADRAVLWFLVSREHHPIRPLQHHAHPNQTSLVRDDFARVAIADVANAIVDFG